MIRRFRKDLVNDFKLYTVLFSSMFSGDRSLQFSGSLVIKAIRLHAT
jgi:hypothetical protein